MTTFESKTTIKKPVSDVYSFLADLNNHEKLMPDNIYNWSSTKDDAHFTIQNMAKLALKVSNRTKDKEIVIIPSEKAPFDLEIKWVLTEDSKGTTEAKYIISADLNVMMKMLAAGPLQKLADHQTSKLEEVLQ